MAGSIQLRQFLFLTREQGWPVERAAEEVGMALAEAKLTVAADSKGDLADIEPLDPATSSLGHNQPPKEPNMSEPVAAEELRLLIERVERMEEEKKGIADDIRDIYGEAKARGYCAKTMRRIVALRKMEKNAREASALLSTYADALGIQGLLL
jgi:uncharacterized protein (UPF0335 family)